MLSSQARGLEQCQIPLVGPNDPPANYKVKLHFAELNEKIAPGDRVFDVRLQGDTVATRLDVAKDAGGPLRSMTREFSHVRVTGDLVVQLIPVAGEPILSAIEVEREE